MKNEDLEKLEVIDLIKMIMMLLVVLYHSCCFFSGNWFAGATPIYKSTYIVNVAQYLNMFHVQTFTMASGFLFYCLKKNMGKYNNIKKDVPKRAKRLLVPYFMVMITWVIPFYIYYHGFNFKDILYKYVLGCSPSQLWFLPMLFWNFIIFYFLFDRIPISMSGMICMIGISVVGGAVLGKIITINIFQINTAIMYLMYYYLGALLYEKVNYVEINKLVTCVLLSILSFLVWKYATGLSAQSILVSLIALAMKNICSLSSVVMVYLVINKWYEKNKFRTRNSIISNIKKYLIENSFGIYLFHQQIIYLVIIPLNGKVSPILQVVISFNIAIMGAGIIIYMIKKSTFLKKIYGL